MEGKIITCCGDCVHYDWKNHRCRNGYTNYDNPKKHFYQDCKALEDLEEHDKQVRADILREIEQAMYHEAFEVNHEEDGLQKWDGGNWIRYKLFENVIDRLKEGK